MAVTIRMTRHGKTKVPFYRIVAADKAMKRDGRYLEVLGTMNPLTDPVSVRLKEDRVKYWISKGAYPSDTIRQIIQKQLPGYLEGIFKSRTDKIRARRTKRKARAGKKVTSAKKAKK